MTGSWAPRQYGPLERLHYRFNWNVDRVLVHFQADYADLRVPEEPSGVQVRAADPDSSDDARTWNDLVRRSYPDPSPPVALLGQLWRDNRLLDIMHTLIVERDGQPVATISGGTYRADPSVAGTMRLAVLPSQRGTGIGAWLEVTSLLKAREPATRYVEEAVMVSREQSIRQQMRLGLRLQEDWSRVVPTVQRRMWPARDLALRRARRVCAQFHEDHPELVLG